MMIKPGVGKRRGDGQQLRLDPPLLTVGVTTGNTLDSVRQSLTPLLHRQPGVVMRQDKILSKGIGEMLRQLGDMELTV
ncbi:hypothetical protein EDF73_101787 [Raoultella sp. BIGb0138]|nr:hypothetical protein EDF73_101787 [Raoultella sp. BIGb0138]